MKMELLIIKQSPFQHPRKFIENSMENMHTDLRVLT